MAQATTQFAALVQWIITFALTGGFWRFVGVWLLVLALTRILWLVRVRVTRGDDDKAKRR